MLATAFVMHPPTGTRAEAAARLLATYGEQALGDAQVILMERALTDDGTTVGTGIGP